MKKRLRILVCLMALCLCGCGQRTQQETVFQFVYGDTLISIHGEAGPILAALGEARSCTEVASCAFDGVERTYYYGSFYLSTYPDNGRDYVGSVWLVDDSVATWEGLRIGSSRAEVESLLGADCFTGENVCTQTRGNSRLTILLENDIVTSIRYDALFS